VEQPLLFDVTTYAERLMKISLVVADEWTTIVKLKPSCSTIQSVSPFSAKTTGPIFTKILHSGINDAI